MMRSIEERKKRISITLSNRIQPKFWSSDDFDDLFDSFKQRKRKKITKVKPKPFLKSFEQLPIWKEVMGLSPHTISNVCRKDLDNEDIVEACKHCNRYFHFRHWREQLKI